MTSPRSETATDLRRSRQLSEVTTLALAGATWLGAESPASRPILLLLGGAALAMVLRRPLALVVVCGLLAQGFAQIAAEGLYVDDFGAVQGRLTLLTDPKPDDLGRQWRAEVAYGGRRWQLVVDDEVASQAFIDALAGERVDIAGRTARLGWGSDWLRTRHVVGSIVADRVGPVSHGSSVHGFANAVRRHLTDGAASLGPRRQALFVGFVLGDDRFQSPVDAASFRRAGLTHLLAVSGQNVAFVLALLGPLLRRLSLGRRLALTLAVISMFALITRFEPSVLRASVMAALAATAVTMGREASSVRVLALTVTALVLVDPFLVDSVGFRLSVAASAGILLLSGPISRRLRGPRPMVLALSVTVAAQLGVAPVLLATFGPVPAASVPANLLAGPVSGPVMMWGMSAGLVAGLVPAIAPAIHVPTGVLLGWIELVAQTIPDWVPGSHDMAALIVMVSLALVALLIRPWSVIFSRVAVVALVALALLPMRVDAPTFWGQTAASGTEVWVGHDGTVVVSVDGRASPERTLLALAAAGLRDVDLVVSRTDADGAVRTAAAIFDDFGSHRLVGSDDVPSGISAVDVGCLHVELSRMAGTIDVVVEHLATTDCGYS